MSKPKVYLAGGFRSGWDDLVVSQMPSWECVQPKNSGLKDMFEFTPWDFAQIEDSNAVLFNIENDNPGLNWLVEIGYAVRAHKYIVLVMDHGFYCELRGIPERYIGMALASADEVFRNLDDAVLHLNDWGARTLTQSIGHLVDSSGTLPPVPFDAAAFKDLHPAFHAAKPTLPVIEGWIVDFVGDQPCEFNPDSVVQGQDETGLPDMIWGRALNSFVAALNVALTICLEEGVYFADEMQAKLRVQAEELDATPHQTPGHRFICVRRAGA